MKERAINIGGEGDLMSNILKHHAHCPFHRNKLLYFTVEFIFSMQWVGSFQLNLTWKEEIKLRIQLHGRIKSNKNFWSISDAKHISYNKKSKVTQKEIIEQRNGIKTTWPYQLSNSKRKV